MPIRPASPVKATGGTPCRRPSVTAVAVASARAASGAVLADPQFDSDDPEIAGGGHGKGPRLAIGADQHVVRGRVRLPRNGSEQASATDVVRIAAAR